MAPSPASKPRLTGQLNSAAGSPDGREKLLNVADQLQSTLQHIVDDVVNHMGYVGAMVATKEADDTLPVRAYALDPQIVDRDFVESWEKRLRIKVIGPKTVADLNDKKYEQNLSVRAITAGGRPVTSDHLHDLFRPVVGKKASALIQKYTGIQKVIAVPFFLEGEVVGNLFAATRNADFSDQEINFLAAFGHQAATAIQSQRRLAEARALESVIFELQASLTDENRAFQIITDAVVERLGYLAALVAPRIGNTLPVRAYTVDSKIVKKDFIDKWERTAGFELLGKKAVAYLDRPDNAEQLSVRAIKSGQVETSDKLYDLGRPVVPKWAADTVQKLLGIKLVIAVPFFLEQEAIGNLYAVSRRASLSRREQEVLEAFAQQAAISIRNAQLYRKSEDRRQVAQIFAKMAFSSAAYVHALRNHIGAFRMYFQMARPKLADKMLQELGDDVLERLNKAADILDNLHEPWRDTPDKPISVNACLNRAVNKIIPDPNDLQNRDRITLHLSLAEELPLIKTSPDMLTETFKILLKNALEAIKEKRDPGNLWVQSRGQAGAAVTVSIRDDGVGIKPENLNKVFEMRWSTKEAGMGFGLFWAKDYITGLGGNLTVDSTWQQGTEFQITLPAEVKA